MNDPVVTVFIKGGGAVRGVASGAAANCVVWRAGVRPTRLLDVAGARAALEERGVGRRVGLLAELLAHLHEQLEGLLRLKRPAARVDHRPARATNAHTHASYTHAAEQQRRHEGTKARGVRPGLCRKEGRVVSAWWKHSVGVHHY